MRLRRVTLSGFKTFARRSEIGLEPGLTAVVGPNGSGKSNLVDAIRWVLGETNARELRGARMEEVIHAGGQGRGPMGMAQVEIILGNEEGRLPVDDVEVAISRRVTRGGDSEYRLNGARIRLRDLERLLGATGLTQTGYAVVAQNDVDGIIEASPQQRRALVEEAAGVRGLRAAREDALSRISSVEARLLRLADLLAEAEPRLEALAAQAAVAAEQRDLASRLAELRGSLAREEWRAARGVMRRAKQRVVAAVSRAEVATEAETAVAARLEAERTALQEVRAAHAAATRRLEDARVAAERASGEQRRWEDHAANAVLQRAVALGELAAAEAEAGALQGQLAELARSGAEAEAFLQGLASRAHQLRQEFEAAEAGVGQCRQRLSVAQERLRSAEAEHNAAAAAERDHSMRAGVLEEAVGQLTVELEAARSRLDGARGAAKELSSQAEQMADALAALKERVDEARSEVTAARQCAAQESAAQAEAQRSASEASARLAALRGQIEGALGATGPLAAAVTTGRLRGSRLLDLVQVRDPADATAIEAALEDHLAALVVDDLEAARQLLDAEAGREEALASTAPGPTPAITPAGARAALDAVDVDPQGASAVRRCLDRVWLVRDMESAERAVADGGGRAVLGDGTVIGAGFVRGGGRPGETLALAAAQRSAAAAASVAEGEAALAGERAEAARRRLEEAEASVQHVTAGLEAARAEVAEALGTATSAAAEVEAAERNVATLDADRAVRSVAAEQARASASAAAAQSAGSMSAVAAAREMVNAERAALESLRAAHAEAARALQLHEIDAARAEPQAREIQHRLATARHGAAMAQQRATTASVRLLAAEEAALVAIARTGSASRRLVEATSEVEAAAALAEAALDPAMTREAAVNAVENERTDAAVAAARAADELAAAELELTTAEARVVELAEAVREDELDDGPEPDAEAAERAEREITRLERRIAALGPVNALAPEQYAGLEERVVRLRSDHDDLAFACVDLRLLASYLSVEIERRFEAVFGAVAYHFRMLFEELFPGGRATLRLKEDEVQRNGDVDPDDRPAVDPGVEILAQPAGKRLQALSLLSGGERALTALALILALQQVNPSPFYIFDEVDAPLDDANIGRFTRLVRRLATTQQFLVVTHNHATMAAAEALYGVTMEGDGSSRLLSVRLVEGEPVAVHPPAVAAVF
jgi:chromosome segregation protein